MKRLVFAVAVSFSVYSNDLPGHLTAFEFNDPSRNIGWTNLICSQAYTLKGDKLLNDKHWSKASPNYDKFGEDRFNLFYLDLGRAEYYVKLNLLEAESVEKQFVGFEDKLNFLIEKVYRCKEL